MASRKNYYIGLMSGTSLDGIDGVLMEFGDQGPTIIRHAQIRYPDLLQSAFRALLFPAENELERCVQASYRRNQLAIEVIDQLCTGTDRASILAIADHGQTIRHCPDAQPPYTLQLHQAAAMAELSGIDCIVDFRSRDIAAGGQGAPLAPAFHQACFGHAHRYRIIVNIGGFANLSLLAPGNAASSAGFDTGPGNTLLDAWCQTHTGEPYDENGQWAASGKVNNSLLTTMLTDPYFHRAPPKSTGNDYFNIDWLQKNLEASENTGLSAVDIQASITALTARTIAQGIHKTCQISDIDLLDLEGIYVCGGGAYNLFLMQQLNEACSIKVQSTEALGISPNQVEAAAFAWLGKQALENTPVDLKETTGAQHNSVPGIIYRA